MNTLLIALLFSSSPIDRVYEVDLIEYHSHIDSEGHFVFDQFLFWNWYYNEQTKSYRYNIVNWRWARLVSTDTELLENIQRDANREWCKKYKNGKFIAWPDIVTWPISHDEKGYLLVFNDPKNSFKVVKIRAKLFRITYSTTDPELWDREYTPENKRRNILPTSKSRSDP